MRPCKVFFAAQYGRRAELCLYRNQLERHGFLVTSSWLDGHEQLYNGKPLGKEYEDAVERGDPDTIFMRGQLAQTDIEDLLYADIVMNFTDGPNAGYVRGGRHVDYGVAIQAAKPLIVIGPIEHFYHCLPQVVRYNDWPSCLRSLLQAQEISNLIHG